MLSDLILGRFRIRRKCCEAQLRFSVKYTFKTYFFRRFTTRINCSHFRCSLLRVSKLTCTSSTCTVWREITTNAALVLAVAQMPENFPVVNGKFGSHEDEAEFFCKKSNVDLFLFFTVAISFNTRSKCSIYWFLNSCFELNGLLLPHFLYDTGEKHGKFKRFLKLLQLSFFVFNFLLFEVNLEFIWLSRSCFVFSAHFMWYFSVKLKKKHKLLQKFSKKAENYWILLEPRSFLVLSIFKIAFVFWFLIWFQCSAMPTMLEKTLAIIEKLKFFQKV